MLGRGKRSVLILHQEENTENMATPTRDIDKLAQEAKRLIDELVKLRKEYDSTDELDKKTDLLLKMSRLYTELVRVIGDITTP